ncbi:Ceramide very long chain fatty acid hydroxylase SCS7, partial [Cyphellophora attinorum]
MPSRTLPTIPLDEVRSHNTKDSCYVTIGEHVYDVTSFIEDHPGGGELILEYAGKDVQEIMKDEISHAHTEAAYEILDDCLVGFTATEPVLNAATKSTSPSSVVPLPPTANGANTLRAEGVDTTTLPTRPVYASTGLSSAEDLSKDTDATTDYTQHKFLDLNKPLFMQMVRSKFSKEFYLEQ